MLKISTWAIHHKWPARLLIAAGSILLNSIGFITGLLFRDIHLIFSPAIAVASLLIAVPALIFYPGKRLKQRMINPALFHIVYYARQKTCDFILLFSSFCMIAYLSNHSETLLFNSWGAKAAVASAGNTVVAKDTSLHSLKEFSGMIKDKQGQLLKWKERKKLLKEQTKAIRHSDNLSKGEKIFLIIVSVFIAVGLTLLMAALVCTLACNGSAALAVLVLVGGAALIAFLLSFSIKKIAGKRKKTGENLETTSN